MLTRALRRYPDHTKARNRSLHSTWRRRFHHLQLQFLGGKPADNAAGQAPNSFEAQAAKGSSAKNDLQQSNFSLISCEIFRSKIDRNLAVAGVRFRFDAFCSPCFCLMAVDIAQAADFVRYFVALTLLSLVKREAGYLTIFVPSKKRFAADSPPGKFSTANQPTVQAVRAQQVIESRAIQTISAYAGLRAEP